MARAALALAVLAAALAACHSPAGDAAAVRAQIEARNAQLQKAYAAGDLDTVTAAFTAEAWQLPPNHAPLIGREQIRAFWEPLVRSGKVEFLLHTEALDTQGPLAIERGRYVLKFTPAEGAVGAPPPFEDSGNYLVHWTREPDGQWRAVTDAPVSERRPPGS